MRAQSKRMPRIGVLPEFGSEFRALITQAFLQLGWVENRDYQLVELGLAYGKVPAPEAARRMVAARPDLILTANSSFALEAVQASRVIPVVMVTCGYPVEIGLAASLARPGKSVTGNSIYAGTGVWGKLLQLLREAKPSTRTVGVLYDYVPPDNPVEESKAVFEELDRAAGLLGVRLQVAQVATPDRLAQALAQMDAGKPDALIVTSGAAMHSSQSRIVQFAIERRLPTIADYPWFSNVDPYPLLVYGPHTASLVRQSAGYAVRILRDGVRPGDLPIQQPAKFELLVNLKTAKALGIVLPQSLLLRADHVIE